MTFPDILLRLSQALHNHQHSPEVRQTMAPSQRRNNPMAEEREVRTAGVLMLLYQKQDKWHMPLIVRPQYDGPHSGQIALPGGRKEVDDEDLWQTATRETEEEVGVLRQTVKELGSLESLYIPNSRYEVSPFIGWVEGQVDFRPDPSEVAELLILPLDLLLDPKFTQREVWKIRGQDVEVPYYRFGAHKIWGATAMMLKDFLVYWEITLTQERTGQT